MLLAGIVMKLGAYGALRVAMLLFPEGLVEWRHFFATLALIGIVFGAAVALAQGDFKFVIGYSSVSHMGFVLLGMMSLTTIGLAGAVFQMFSHGIIAGLLFAVVGRMVYDRVHTRDLALLNVAGLGKSLPFAAIVFLLAAIASMGFPGFSGFVAEVAILIGVWKTLPAYAVITGVGILLGIAFMLRALRRTFYSDAVSDSAPHSPPLPSITLPEKVGGLILLGSSLVVGIYPRIIFDLIEPALRQPLFKGIASSF
jgi:NADH-quinone oxidoreductase subunit M